MNCCRNRLLLDNVLWPKPLEAGSLGDRFIVLNPQKNITTTENAKKIEEVYKGITRSVPGDEPLPVGGIWFPKAPAEPPQRLIIHFYGSAYVMFGSRPGETCDIAFASDSAGGNLALALLRYIKEETPKRDPIGYPGFIGAGTSELLYDDILKFAKNLKEKGNDVEVLETPNSCHIPYQLGKDWGQEDEQAICIMIMMPVAAITKFLEETGE
ncbi:Alpha/Beta hydrolase protein [Penicillium herquei]|nr:Alpha/Beta hydrolase protein [Penicillium herquei]